MALWKVSLFGLTVDLSGTGHFLFAFFPPKIEIAGATATDHEHVEAWRSNYLFFVHRFLQYNGIMVLFNAVVSQGRSSGSLCCRKVLRHSIATMAAETRLILLQAGLCP